MKSKQNWVVVYMSLVLLGMIIFGVVETVRQHQPIEQRVLTTSLAQSTTQQRRNTKRISSTVSIAVSSTSIPSSNAASAVTIESGTSSSSSAIKQQVSSVQSSQYKASVKPTENTIELSINGQNGPLLTAKKVPIKNGESVWTATQAITHEQGITLSYTGSGTTVYLKAIDGQFAQGMSGWKYQVNGVTPNKSCGAYLLKNQDIVVWNYVKS